MNTKVFRELRAKKAKFGFEAHVTVNTIEYLGRVLTGTKDHDPSVLIEMPNNMGHATLKMYTDNPGTAEYIRSIIT